MSDPNRKAEKEAKALDAKRLYDGKTAGLLFEPWPKIARLNREITVTEKLDGTNAAIGIVGEFNGEDAPITYRVYAQSRTRIITPENDNMGFARWVEQNEGWLVQTLGPGLHFGEWWGVGIQRGYDLSERRFSLFNTQRWNTGEGALALANARLNGVAIYCVPVLWEGTWMVEGVAGYTDDADEFNEDGSPKFIDKPAPPSRRFMPEFELEWLRECGSRAVPGYMKAEGVVIFHKASGQCFKATCEKDAEHKGPVVDDPGFTGAA